MSVRGWELNYTHVRRFSSGLEARRVKALRCWGGLKAFEAFASPKPPNPYAGSPQQILTPDAIRPNVASFHSSAPPPHSPTLTTKYPSRETLITFCFTSQYPHLNPNTHLQEPHVKLIIHTTYQHQLEHSNGPPKPTVNLQALTTRLTCFYKSTSTSIPFSFLPPTRNKTPTTSSTKPLALAFALAFQDEDLAARVQALLSSPSFRCYRSTDVVGVEVAGALKNVLAIACGISDGLGFGNNARAALITRGPRVGGIATHHGGQPSCTREENAGRRRPCVLSNASLQTPHGGEGAGEMAGREYECTVNKMNYPGNWQRHERNT